MSFTYKLQTVRISVSPYLKTIVIPSANLTQLDEVYTCQWWLEETSCNLLEIEVRGMLSNAFRKATNQNSFWRQKYLFTRDFRSTNMICSSVTHPKSI